jgi:hypothetical protein
MRRPFAAAVAIVALLFSQLAVSAFACPRDNVAQAMEAMDSMPEGHCEKQKPNLCGKHCDYGAANVNQASPDLAPDVLALPLPWRAEPLPALAIATAPVARTPQSHPPPPLILLFGALRI